ncbi:hypothetical protein J8852_02905 [Bacteroides uniformis]|uniref:hypothetical protein n=1 Tax=Bacteroides uniformis TaxID=820 RepID=UPI001F3073EC|nr:hypothetical protein [Bacteroides uniformis]MCE8473407.1 hypothetical protein [Bacteroides uniformis]
MKRLNIIFIVLLYLSCCNVYSQDNLYQCKILNTNLSPLFSDLDLIGFLGDDFSRIDIKFLMAQKISNYHYKIKGASRTRLSIICQFEGEIFIDSILFCRKTGESIHVDGFVLGRYFFKELGSKNSGTFRGHFKHAFMLQHNTVYKAINDIEELKYNLFEYIGEWESSKKRRKKCNWADSIIPETPKDFYCFNDAGEWYVNLAYRKNGWENIYNAYYNPNLDDNSICQYRKLEEQMWWIENIEKK